MLSKKRICSQELSNKERSHIPKPATTLACPPTVCVVARAHPIEFPLYVLRQDRRRHRHLCSEGYPQCEFPTPLTPAEQSENRKTKVGEKLCSCACLTACKLSVCLGCWLPPQCTQTQNRPEGFSTLSGNLGGQLGPQNRHRRFS